MGIQSVPAASTASAPYLGAGSKIVDVVNDLGYYSTSLAAGNYIVVCNFSGTPDVYYDTNTRDDSFGWSYSAYESSVAASQIRNKEATLVKLTTTSTIWIGTPWVHRGNLASFYDWYIGNGGSPRMGCNVNWADPTKPMYVSNPSDRPRTIALPDNPDVFNPLGNANTNNRVSTSPVNSIGANSGQPQYGYLQGYYYMTQTTGTSYSGTIHYSTDCITWSSVTPTGMTGRIADFAYGSWNQYRVVVSDAGGVGDCIASSTNGTTWTTRSNPTIAGFYGVTAGNSLFVAVGYTGATGGAVIATSTDSITWSNRTSPFSNAASVSLWCVAYNPTTGIYFAMANAYDTTNGGSCATSTNGTTWTICTPAFLKGNESIGSFLGNSFHQNGTMVAYGNLNEYSQARYRVFVGGGYFWRNCGNAVVAASTNGILWRYWSTGYGAMYAHDGWAWYHPTNGLMYQMRQDSYASSWKMPTAQYTIYNHTTA